jgi:cytidyltransferase-like protein
LKNIISINLNYYYNSNKMFTTTDINSFVDAIHAINKKDGNRIISTITGGAFSSIGYLMSRPGASSSILQLNCPYAQEATIKYMEEPTESFASLKAANELSITSLNQCRDLLEQKYTFIGVGVTAALATNRWLKGDHRMHIVITTDINRFTFSLNLYKGNPETPENLFRTRAQEDELCGKLVIFSIAYICKIIPLTFFDTLIQENFLNIMDKYDFHNELFHNPIHRLLHSKIPEICDLRHEIVNSVLVVDGKYFVNPSLKNIVMLPGSFNPLHDGHISMLQNACALNHTDGIFEMCVVNADKPPLSSDEIIARIATFNSKPVVLTNAPLFTDKDKLFPGVSYAIGVDTVIRLMNPKYTHGDRDLMFENILKMTFSNTKFYVGSRLVHSAGITKNFPLKLKDDDILRLTNIMFIIPNILHKNFIEIDDDKNAHLCSSVLRSS